MINSRSKLVTFRLRIGLACSVSFILFNFQIVIKALRHIMVNIITLQIKCTRFYSMFLIILYLLHWILFLHLTVVVALPENNKNFSLQMIYKWFWYQFYNSLIPFALAHFPSSHSYNSFARNLWPISVLLIWPMLDHRL